MTIQRKYSFKSPKEKLNPRDAKRFLKAEIVDFGKDDEL